MKYQKRCVDTQLDELMGQLPAILLDGPKAVGKTSTAMERAITTRRMDVEAERVRAEADIDWVVSGEKPILIDEWQLLTESWTAVKHAVDKDRSGGQYLLTGSMPDKSTHSGAGRINALRMRPMSFAERNVIKPTLSFSSLLAGELKVINGETDFSLPGYCEEIAKSGFPGMRDYSARAHKVALDSYIQRIIDSDIPEMGYSIRKPESMRAWLKSYASVTATTASWESIRDGANPGSSETPAKSTTIPYRDALTRLRILDDLPAWIPSKNQLKRVGQAPKHYLADPALALRLLDLDAKSLESAISKTAPTVDGSLVGQMFEALVALSVRVYAETNFARVSHYRERSGRREVDLIVEREDGKILAIEVKLGNKVSSEDFEHLRWLRSEMPDDIIDCIVVYSGKHAYRNGDVAVIPLALLGP